MVLNTLLTDASLNNSLFVFNGTLAKTIPMNTMTNTIYGMSYSFWVYFPANPGDKGIWSMNDTTGVQTANFIMFYYLNQELYFWIHDYSITLKTVRYRLDLSDGNNLNKWYHFVWVMKPNNKWDIYRDGVIVVDSIVGYEVDNITHNYPPIVARSYNNLGMATPAYGYFNGSISKFRVYDGILTKRDVASLYAETYDPSFVVVPAVSETNPPCFKEDTKILCFQDGEEKYVSVQDIRTGVLVKTLLNGYVPVNLIGTTKLYNSGDAQRTQNRLYVCTNTNYPEISEDLVITGCHSILVDTLNETERDKTMEISKEIYATDDKYRLMACVDDRAQPYPVEGTFNIWHLALDNDNYLYNYGIYANGLLVESCSQRYLRELSGMTLV